MVSLQSQNRLMIIVIAVVTLYTVIACQVLCCVYIKVSVDSIFGVPTSLLCGLTQTAPPSAPQHLTANDTGAIYVVLSWLPPLDTGLGGDLSYKVFYQDINGTSYNMNTNTTYHDVTDLSPNTTYTMTVMADNGIAGNEENRSVSVSVTTKGTATGNEITTGISPINSNVYSWTDMALFVFYLFSETDTLCD